MKATSLEAIYRRTIENKKVCFVGACPNIIGKNFGNKIDNYDIVVRTNHFWKPFKNEYMKDYGRRCDILYVNNQYYREMRPLPTTEMKIRGISWLCMKGVRTKDFRRYSKDLFTRLYVNTIRKVCKFIPSATAGTLIYEDILQYNPKELYITGIDFFASRKPVFEVDNYKEYIDGYLPRKIQLKGNILNKNKKSDGHNFIGNAKYIYGLFRKNQNFKTDTFLYNLLKKIVNKEIEQGDIEWKRA